MQYILGIMTKQRCEGEKKNLMIKEQVEIAMSQDGICNNQLGVFMFYVLA